MSGSTPIAGLPYATLGDAPNANTLAESLAISLDHIVIPKYATTSARDAANPSPTAGDMCYVVSKGYYQYSSAGSWGLVLGTVAGKFQSFATVWSTTTGLHTPGIGNGTLAMRYMVVGAVCFVKFFFTFGSTTFTSSGATTDNWQWSLPLPVGDVTTFAGGAVALQGPGGGDAALGVVLLNPAAQTFSIGIYGAREDGTAVDNAGLVDTHSPWTWTASSGNTLAGEFFYECTN